MERNYWASIVRGRRLTRRRAIQGAFGVGIGATALSLLGCGSDEDEPAPTSSSTGSTTTSAEGNSSATGSSASTGSLGSSGSSALIDMPQDTTASAVRGGILPGLINSDVDGFSAYPHRSLTVSSANGYAYSKFFKPVLANRAKGEVPPTTVEGDLLQSFEVSPDGLTITGRMRPNVGLDPRAPTNGRSMNTEDVLYSWDLIKEFSKTRGLIANEVSPTAPIRSITTPDQQTVVFELAKPSPSILASLAFTLFGNFVYPVEAESDFDPNVEMRGSGPWMLETYEPSIKFEYRRNPNFYDSSHPYLDGFNLPIVPEYASQLAQFRAGSVYSITVSAEDQVQTKRDFPDILMLERPFNTAVSYPLHFNYLPGSPWLDERLRLGLSMTIDRDLLTDAIWNVEGMRKEGIDAELFWNSFVGVGESEFFLDPQSQEFGENAKYFQVNLEEAAKLVNAATGQDKFESVLNYPNPPTYGASYHQTVQILKGMFEEGPFVFTNNGVDYGSVWARVISGSARLTGGHDFEGVALAGVAEFPEVDSWFSGHLIPGGPYFKFEEDYPDANDKWYELLEAQQLEQDHDKRIEIVKDFQRYAAGVMHIVPTVGHATRFQMAWNWAGNFGTFEDRGGPELEYMWFDESKKKA